MQVGRGFRWRIFNVEAQRSCILKVIQLPRDVELNIVAQHNPPSLTYEIWGDGLATIELCTVDFFDRTAVSRSSYIHAVCPRLTSNLVREG
jgi:hypothetical protein